MLDRGAHSEFVDAWLERSAKGLSPDLLLQLFESAFAALWRRTNKTLGEVTLGAITQRVLYNTAERFPLFAAVSFDAQTGIKCNDLDQRLRFADGGELKEAVRSFLTEFLSVLGNLTAEILTQELHAELNKVPASAAATPNQRDPGTS